MKLGIIAALHEEIATLIAQMGKTATKHSIGQRDYYEGVLNNRDCVVVLARIGKVAAAVTTLTLIREFKVKQVVFAGVAGGLGKDVNIGDVVVATQLLQHDIDSSPLFPRFEVPLLGVSFMHTDTELTNNISKAATNYLQHELHKDIDTKVLKQFNVLTPKVHIGTIISGDQFIGNSDQVKKLCADVPNALCVEMEGAALAQVCYEYDIPFAVFRTISDSANEAASVDFSAFLHQVARYYAHGILEQII